jgi:hypothetical protein
METAVQVLIILLDFGFPVKTTNTPSPDAAAAGAASQVPHISSKDYQAPGFNVFRKYLSSVSAPDELNFIFRGFARLLNNVRIILLIGLL